MRILVVLIASILVLALLVSTAKSDFTGFGRSVRINFAYHIGAAKSDDIITNTSNYIISQDSGIVSGIIFSGSESFGTLNNNTVSSENYSLQLKQSLEKNRFYFFLTNGTAAQVESKISYVSKDIIIPKTIGEYSIFFDGTPPLYIRLQYSNKDIINSSILSKGNLIVRNEGMSDRGWKIVIESIG